MSVVAFLPDRLLAHVRLVFQGEPDFVIAKSWDEVNSIVREKPVTALILDPAADGSMNVEAVESLLKRYPSLPVVAYVFLTKDSFGAIARLSRAGLQNVVLQKFEDSPAKFRETVERARGNPLKRKLIDGLRPQLSQLPLKLVATVDEMLESPHRFKSAQDVAERAEMSPLKLYRNFSIAGLGSPRRLLRAAKLLKAVGYLQDSGYSVRDVARKVGYRNSRIFGEHTLDVFSLTPSRVRTHLAPEEAVEKLVTWLTVLEDTDAD
jgi:AraC-like DNA-binding protein